MVLKMVSIVLLVKVSVKLVIEWGAGKGQVVNQKIAEVL